MPRKYAVQNHMIFTGAKTKPLFIKNLGREEWELIEKMRDLNGLFSVADTIRFAIKKAASTAAVLMLFTMSVFAGNPLVVEDPFDTTGTPACTSITTYTWTSIGTPTAGRTAIYFTVRSTATANMQFHWGTSTTPTVSTATAAGLAKPGITQSWGARDYSYLYLVSQNTSSAEDICYGEVKQ